VGLTAVLEDEEPFDEPVDWARTCGLEVAVRTDEPAGRCVELEGHAVGLEPVQRESRIVSERALRLEFS
jgi:hypothetical protein